MEDLVKQATYTAECFRHHRQSRDLVDDAHICDASLAWEDYLTYHYLHNGPGSSLANDEKCKYWFILGYNAMKLSKPMYRPLAEAKILQSAVESFSKQLKEHIESVEREKS